MAPIKSVPAAAKQTESDIHGAASPQAMLGPRRLVVRSYFDGERHHNKGPYALILERERISEAERIVAMSRPTRPRRWRWSS